MIEKGKEVSIEYSVFLEDKTPVDSNVGKEPLVFRAGDQKVLAAVENVVSGMNVGERKEVILMPEEAYGMVNPDAIKEVEAKHIPLEHRIPGTMLVVPNPEEGDMLIQVKDVKPDSVILDFNHPLAGKTLIFDVKVLEVK